MSTCACNNDKRKIKRRTKKTERQFGKGKRRKTTKNICVRDLKNDGRPSPVRGLIGRGWETFCGGALAALEWCSRSSAFRAPSPRISFSPPMARSFGGVPPGPLAFPPGAACPPDDHARPQNEDEFAHCTRPRATTTKAATAACCGRRISPGAVRACRGIFGNGPLPPGSGTVLIAVRRCASARTEHGKEGVLFEFVRLRRFAASSRASGLLAVKRFLQRRSLGYKDL